MREFYTYKDGSTIPIVVNKPKKVDKCEVCGYWRTTKAHHEYADPHDAKVRELEAELERSRIAANEAGRWISRAEKAEAALAGEVTRPCGCIANGEPCTIHRTKLEARVAELESECAFWVESTESHGEAICGKPLYLPAHRASEREAE